MSHLLQCKLLFIKVDMEENMVELEPPLISRGNLNNTHLLLSNEIKWKWSYWSYICCLVLRLLVLWSILKVCTMLLQCWHNMIWHDILKMSLKTFPLSKLSCTLSFCTYNNQKAYCVVGHILYWPKSSIICAKYSCLHMIITKGVAYFCQGTNKK